MGMIEDKAKLVVEDMARNDAKHKEPMLAITVIGIIIGIIADVVQTYLACKQSSQQAAMSMRSGGIVERFRLRRAIRQHLDDPEMHGYVAEDMFHSTLSVAEQLKDEEVSQMYAEVSKQMKKKEKT
jgi:Tfp pilus assembly protein PilV